MSANRSRLQLLQDEAAQGSVIQSFSSLCFTHTAYSQLYRRLLSQQARPPTPPTTSSFPQASPQSAGHPTTATASPTTTSTGARERSVAEGEGGEAVDATMEVDLEDEEVTKLQLRRSALGSARPPPQNSHSPFAFQQSSPASLSANTLPPTAAARQPPAAARRAPVTPARISPSTSSWRAESEPTISQALGEEPNSDEGDGEEEKEGIDEGNLASSGFEGHFLRSVLEQVKSEIQKSTSDEPINYTSGTFWRRAMDPFFVLKREAYLAAELEDFGAQKVGGFLNDVFVWLPNLLVPKDCLLCPSCKVKLKQGAFLTRRGAIDKQLLRIIRVNFSDGVGSEAASEMCLKAAALDYDDRQIMWQQALLRAPVARWPTRNVTFPTFDRSSVPTRWYLKNLFVDWSQTIRWYLDQAIAVLTAFILKWDHSFKIPKLLAKLAGCKSFEALFTIMNEFGQVRFQAFVPTKSFAHLASYFEGILASLKATGQALPVYGYTDNPSAEVGFVDAIISSLRSTVSTATSSSKSSLPRLTTSGYSIIVESNKTQINHLCLPFIDQLVEDEERILYAGFDMEWHFVEGEPEKPVALIQILVLETKSIFLFRVSSFDSRDSAPQNLIALLEHHRFVKVGRAVGNDMLKLQRDWGIKVESKSGYLDVYDLAVSKGLVDAFTSRGGSLLQKKLTWLVEVILKHHLDKGHARTSDWASGEGGNGQLSPTQIEYAACDALAGLLLYLALLPHPTVNLRLTLPLPSGTQIPVLILPRGGATPVARGFISPTQPTSFTPATRDSLPASRVLKKGQVVVRVLDILATGFKLPLHKPSLTLGDLANGGGPHGVFVLVNLSALRTRSLSPPFEPPPPVIVEDTLFEDVLSDEDGGTKAGKGGKAARLRVLEQHASEDEFSAEDNSSDSEGEDASDSDSEEESADDGPDEEEDDAEIVERMEWEASIPSTSAVPLSSITNPKPAPPLSNARSRIKRSFRHPPAPATPDPRSTRLGYDLFHAQDKVTKTWSKKHSLFNEASRVLAATILVPDAEDKARMEVHIAQHNQQTLAALQLKGQQATYIPLTYARLKRKAPDWVRRRVKSFAPAIPRMVRDLRQFARSYGDVPCSLTKKPLFTKETWKKFEGLLSDAEAGWLSDPPDISLYTVLGQDKLGFDIYHCSRGSTEPEAIHRILRLLYRAAQGSPDLADASLAWWRHEHNIKAGARNKLNMRHDWHFDSWLGDLIDSNYELMNSRSVYLYSRSPLNPVDGSRSSIGQGFAAMTETYGFTKIPDELSAKYQFEPSICPRQDRHPPNVGLAHLQTARVDQYSFLASCQGTKYAVTAVHGTAEVSLFYDLVKDSRCTTKGKVAPEKMATVWSEYAKGRQNSIFYKLPQHLIKFQKVVATLNDKLKSAARVSRVVTPLTLNNPPKPKATKENRRTRATPAWKSRNDIPVDPALQSQSLPAQPSAASAASYSSAPRILPTPTTTPSVNPPPPPALQPTPTPAPTTAAAPLAQKARSKRKCTLCLWARSSAQEAEGCPGRNGANGKSACVQPAQVKAAYEAAPTGKYKPKRG
ncbi:hypothetical protein P7C70_g7701, partial [Phenoliferia sp. Uapishka_3]